MTCRLNPTSDLWCYNTRIFTFPCRLANQFVKTHNHETCSDAVAQQACNLARGPARADQPEGHHATIPSLHALCPVVSRHIMTPDSLWIFMCSAMEEWAERRNRLMHKSTSGTATSSALHPILSIISWLCRWDDAPAAW